MLAFADDGTLRAANAGATTILGDTLSGCELVTLAEWTQHREFRDAILQSFAENDEDWHRQIEITADNGSQQTLLMHGSRLPQSTDGGWVVVFDDISTSSPRNAPPPGRRSRGAWPTRSRTR